MSSSIDQSDIQTRFTKGINAWFAAHNIRVGHDITGLNSKLQASVENFAYNRMLDGLALVVGAAFQAAFHMGKLPNMGPPSNEKLVSSGDDIYKVLHILEDPLAANVLGWQLKPGKLLLVMPVWYVGGALQEEDIVPLFQWLHKQPWQEGTRTSSACIYPLFVFFNDEQYRRNISKLASGVHVEGTRRTGNHIVSGFINVPERVVSWPNLINSMPLAQYSQKMIGQSSIFSNVDLAEVMKPERVVTSSDSINSMPLARYTQNRYTQKMIGQSSIFSNAHLAEVMKPILKTSEQWQSEGFALYNAQRYKEAIADYDRALALNPRYALAYNNRGVAYNDLKEYQKAIDDYDQAIALDPKFAIAYSNRGLTYLNLNEYQKAIADCNQAITLNSQLVGAYNVRGLAYYYLKNYLKAIADYDHALAIDPGLTNVKNNRELALDLLISSNQS